MLSSIRELGKCVENYTHMYNISIRCNVEAIKCLQSVLELLLTIYSRFSEVFGQNQAFKKINTNKWSNCLPICLLKSV